jgi:hypothetical protein
MAARYACEIDFAQEFRATHHGDRKVSRPKECRDRNLFAVCESAWLEIRERVSSTELNSRGTSNAYVRAARNERSRQLSVLIKECDVAEKLLELNGDILGMDRRKTCDPKNGYHRKRVADTDTVVEDRNHLSRPGNQLIRGQIDWRRQAGELILTWHSDKNQLLACQLMPENR